MVNPHPFLVKGEPKLRIENDAFNAMFDNMKIILAE